MTAAALCVLCAAAAAWLALPPRPRLRLPRSPRERRSARGARTVVAALAGVAGWAFVGGPYGPPAGVAAAVVAWRVLAGAEPAAERRRREAERAELPHLVALLASALRAGHDPVGGLDLVCAALPGPASQRLLRAVATARLGAPETAWRDLAADPALGRLGRVLARSQATGAPVTEGVERLADELADDLHAEAEDRARRVGVRAAVPLGVCLLPAFLLLGIVPVVASMLGSLTP